MRGHVDGNALAGILSELQLDVTVRGRCAGCGDVAVLARAVVYGDEQARVARCAACSGVLFVLFTEPGGMRLQLRGMSWLDTAPE